MAHLSSWRYVVVGVSWLDLGSWTSLFSLIFGLQRSLESSVSRHT